MNIDLTPIDTRRWKYNEDLATWCGTMIKYHKKSMEYIYEHRQHDSIMMHVTIPNESSLFDYYGLDDDQCPLYKKMDIDPNEALKFYRIQFDFLIMLLKAFCTDPVKPPNFQNHNIEPNLRKHRA